MGRVAAVDAVERSAAMIEVGRSSPGGDLVSWHREAAETFTASGPFDLAVVGEAMHWFDLPVVIARLRDMLRPDTPLALVERSTQHAGLADVVEVIKRFSRADDYDPSYDLTARGLWRQVGELVPPTRGFRQSPEDYLASLRSTSSLAQALMTNSENIAFDRAILDVVEPMTDSQGFITLDVTARRAWGSIG